MNTTTSAKPKVCPTHPILRHFREMKKLHPDMTPGVYGLHLFMAEPVDPILEADFNRRMADPFHKLKSLEMTCGITELQTREILNHDNPEVRGKAAVLLQAFILRLQEVAGGAQ